MVVLFSMVEKPTFTGDLNGFEIENNDYFDDFKLIDSTFSNKNKTLLILNLRSNSKSEIFNGIDSLSSVIKDEYSEATILSPKTFYKKLITHWVNRSDSFDRFTNEAKQVPILQQLFSKDGESIILIIEKMNIEHSSSFMKRITALSYPGIKNIKTYNQLKIKEGISDAIKKDIIKITLAILSLFFIVIIIYFRSWKALVFISIMIIPSIIISLYLFPLMKYEINLISLLVIPIVLILSLSDALHLLTSYVKSTQDESALKKVIRSFIVPSFYSSLTTSFAFFTFYLFNDSVFIQEFGLITSIALLLEFVISFLLISFLLKYLAPKRLKERSLQGVTGFLSKHKKQISIFLVLSLIIVLPLGYFLKFGTESTIFFPKDSEIETIHKELDQDFFSSAPLQIMIQSTRKNNDRMMLNKEVRLLVEHFNKFPAIDKINSSLEPYYFKSKVGTTENLFNHLGRNNPYFNAETNTYKIELYFNETESMKDFESTILKPYILKNKTIVVKYGALPLLIREVNNSVSKTLLQSLITSGIGIFLILLLMTKSIKTALYSLIPNLVPIGFMIIVFVLFRIDINIITAISIIISIGMLDDDTVHILYKRMILNEPMESLKFSTLLITLLLTLGFLSFTFSDFKPIQSLGWICSLIFIIGIICEFTIMQLVIDQYKKRNP
jgi:predicted RND superfamily exporter protein